MGQDNVKQALDKKEDLKKYIDTYYTQNKENANDTIVGVSKIEKSKISENYFYSGEILFENPKKNEMDDFWVFKLYRSQQKQKYKEEEILKMIEENEENLPEPAGLIYTEDSSRKLDHYRKILPEIFPKYNVHIFVNAMYYVVKRSRGHAFIVNENEIPVLIVIN